MSQQSECECNKNDKHVNAFADIGCFWSALAFAIIIWALSGFPGLG